MIDLDLVYAAYQAEEEETRQKNIIVARNYYAGEQNTKMSKRQQEFIGYNLANERFAINYCAPVVDAVVERMIVSGFLSDDEDYAAWCWDVWEHNRMDAKQRDTHQQAVNEVEAFVAVDWPEGDDMPTFTPYPRYTDRQLDGGTGFGCKAHYVENDPNQELEAVSKRWYETYRDEKKQTKVRERMSIYFPDRIERYVAVTEGRLHNAGWEPFADEEGEAVIPRVTAAGKPLGIPIAPIRKPGAFELWDAIPLQDLINKTALDIIATADACGFPIRLTYNWMATTDGKAPEDDGGNYLTMTPGAWVAVRPGGGADASTDVLPPADLIPMLAALDSYIMKLAQVTDTPAARFQITGQIAAEGTLKQQEGPLLAKVRAYKTLVGNGWENLFTITRNLSALHGKTFADDVTVEAQWEPSETRDDKTLGETLLAKMQTGVPRETLWSEWGYDADEIAKMKAQSAEELQEQSNIGGALLRQFEQGGVV